MRLTIPDTLVDAYQRWASPKKTVESTLTRQLGRFCEIPLDERIIIVRNADRERIEIALGRSIGTGVDLADTISALTQVTIGGAEFTLSPKVLEALQRRAKFESKPPAEIMQEFIQEIEAQVTSMVLM